MRAEIKQRILEAYTLLCQRYSYSDILRYFADKYKAGARTADRYISQATKQIELECKDEIESRRTKANKTFDIAIKESMRLKKWRDVAYIQALQNKINGLENTTHKTELTIKGDVNKKIKELFFDE